MRGLVCTLQRVWLPLVNVHGHSISKPSMIFQLQKVSPLLPYSMRYKRRQQLPWRPQDGANKTVETADKHIVDVVPFGGSVPPPGIQFFTFFIGYAQHEFVQPDDKLRRSTGYRNVSCSNVSTSFTAFDMTADAVLYCVPAEQI